MGNSLLSKPPGRCRLIPNSRKLKSGLLDVKNYLHPDVLLPCDSADVYRSWANDLDVRQALMMVFHYEDQ